MKTAAAISALMYPLWMKMVQLRRPRSIEVIEVNDYRSTGSTTYSVDEDNVIRF
ncbi:hypothetical protein OH492_17880 [Vibrio chagasii]|nr:hypothetical protein [Vibrio chagasii]